MEFRSYIVLAQPFDATNVTVEYAIMGKDEADARAVFELTYPGHIVKSVVLKK